MIDSLTALRAPTRRMIQGNKANWLPRMVEVLALGLGLAGPRLITLITLPVAYALMGATVVGRLAVIEATIFYIPVLGGMAFATYAQRYVTRAQPDRLAEVWQSSITVTAGLSIFAAVVVAVLRPPDTSLWFCAILAAALQGTLPTWIFRGFRNFRDYRRASLLQVAFSATTIVLGLAAGWLPAYFLGNITGYLVVMYIARQNHLAVRPRLNTAILRRAAMFIPSQAAIQIYISVDVLLVRYFLGLADAGRYATLYRVQYLFMAFYGLIQQFMIPRLRMYTDLRERTANHVLWIGALGFQWIILLVLLVAHGIMPEPFRSYWYVTAILLGQFSVATVCVLPVLLNLTGNPKRYAAITMTGAAANIAANCVLIQLAGLAGAAFATCFSEFVVGSLAAISVSRLTMSRALLLGASLAAPLAILLSQAAQP